MELPYPTEAKFKLTLCFRSATAPHHYRFTLRSKLEHDVAKCLHLYFTNTSKRIMFRLLMAISAIGFLKSMPTY